MRHAWHPGSVGRKISAAESGQAAVEFALIAALMLVLFCMLVDFSRAIHDVQVMASLSREGSNLASRGTTLSASANAVVAGDSPLNLSSNGEVIVTSVTNTTTNNGRKGATTYLINDQQHAGLNTQTSKVGSLNAPTTVTLPPSVAQMLLPGQTTYVTEVFYSYQPVTPIHNLLKLVMPSTLYQVAYF